MATKTTRHKFVNLHLKLLALEREEEMRRKKQQAEDSMLTLVVKTYSKEKNDPVNEDDDDEDKDKYTCYLTLQQRNLKRLPPHSIEQGGQVLLSRHREDPDKFCHSAVVVRVMPLDLKLRVPVHAPFFSGETVSIKVLENADHDRLARAMRWLRDVDTKRCRSDEPAVPLVREMFKEHQQEALLPGTVVSHKETESPQRFINQKLNTSQRKAVELALSDRRLVVIHGPPGTGKTTTVVEVILQHVEREHRVLVCASSNKAVDNLLEGVWKQTKKLGCVLSMKNVLRIGQLARMDEKHEQFSPEMQLEKCLKENRKSGVNIETVMKNAIVVMSTLTSVHQYINAVDDDERHFDLLVIDECAQAIEAACWLAIPSARKLVLAGDHCQLPPTILSEEAGRRGLSLSLMERQASLHGEGVVHMLDTQYRMNKHIQGWSSQQLYGGRLKAAPEVSHRLLTDLAGIRSTKRTQPTLLLVDTAGCKLQEMLGTKTTSYRNTGEADLVVCHAKSLVEAGLPAKDIGVITPYKQQVALIDRKMEAAGLDVEVNSVDGFQGREKEAVLLSLVRSNDRRQVGFVGDRRRLNVAVTRARRHLFVVCDTATVCRDYNLRTLVNYIKCSGEARSAYCDRCPGGKDSHSTNDDDDFDDDDGDDNASDVSLLEQELGAMHLPSTGCDLPGFEPFDELF